MTSSFFDSRKVRKNDPKILHSDTKIYSFDEEEGEVDDNKTVKWRAVKRERPLYPKDVNVWHLFEEGPKFEDEPLKYDSKVYNEEYAEVESTCTIRGKVSVSTTKIYMVLEYVNEGKLFDKIALKGRLSECEGRKGVYHIDLKPENVLIDAKGNVKVFDFGLGALPQHLSIDELLHTTCGSLNHIAPEVLSNRDYDGARSDIWFCGLILCVTLTGSLPFDDRNLVVLYQKIVRGDIKFPKCISPGAQDILRRILDPNPITRINITGIKEHVFSCWPH
ncbi:CBL-interacting protein kinase 21-like [Zingiber officinale]|uniref:CBL-interacting protein kinase 21-like n=1 Tax=Zingiber officinale TaxID=94328 RepID=UPI001C4B1969|nr:CBL-interacting protein kinase 21-like [Zingiber officinale]